MQRHLLAKLGMSEAEIEDFITTPPPVPSDDEIRDLLRKLLDADSLEAASRELRSDSIKQHCGPALEEAVFADEFLNATTNPEAHSTIVRSLCEISPHFIGKNIEPFLDLENQDDVKKCLESAFSIPFDGDKLLLEKLIGEDRTGQATAALFGLRKRLWNKGLASEELQELLPICIRVCHPDFPIDGASISTDPALVFCQVFASIAAEQLSQLPYFSSSNPHLKEILSWLPDVVEHASAENVTQLLQDFSNPTNHRHVFICCDLLPLAASKLQASCESTVDKLLRHPNKDLQTAAIHAKATIVCGHDPFYTALRMAREDKFDLLPKEQKALLLVEGFDGQVRNGGVRQFLSNDHHGLANETLDSLALLGISAGHRLLDAAIDAFRSTEAFKATQLLQAAVRSGGKREIDEETWKQINDLQKHYYENEKCSKRIACEYILANPEKFQTDV